MRKPSRNIPGDGFKGGENDLDMRSSGQFSCQRSDMQPVSLIGWVNLRTSGVAWHHCGSAWSLLKAMDIKEFRFKDPLYAFTRLKRLCRKDYSRIFPESKSHSRRSLGCAKYSVQSTGTYAPRRLEIAAVSTMYWLRGR